MKHPFEGILENWYQHKQQLETGGLSLWELMAVTQDFQASLQRDRIFALLGLATPDARSHIVPDYSNETPNHIILAKLTFYLLSSTRKTKLLQGAIHCRATGAPSWVADWMDRGMIRPVVDSIGAKKIGGWARPDYPGETRPDHPGGAWKDHFGDDPGDFLEPPKLEFPMEDVLRTYRLPSLLVWGLILGRVHITMQMPSASFRRGEYFTDQDTAFKNKIGEWISFVLRQWGELSSTSKPQQAAQPVRNDPHCEPSDILSDEELIKTQLFCQLTSSRGSELNLSTMATAMKREKPYKFSLVTHKLARTLTAAYDTWIQGSRDTDDDRFGELSQCKLCRKGALHDKGELVLHQSIPGTRGRCNLLVWRGHWLIYNSW